MKRAFLLFLSQLALVFVATAGVIPDNLVVTSNGLDWVWASPCAAVAPSCGGDVGSVDGFVIATDAQWNQSWANTTDLYNAFTLNGTDQLCASQYFNSGYSHCDSSDAQTGSVWGAPFSVAPTSGTSDTFLVRGDAVAPEPSTYALVTMGLGAVLAGARRRR